MFMPASFGTGLGRHGRGRHYRAHHCGRSSLAGRRHSVTGIVVRSRSRGNRPYVPHDDAVVPQIRLGTASRDGTADDRVCRNTIAASDLLRHANDRVTHASCGRNTSHTHQALARRTSISQCMSPGIGTPKKGRSRFSKFGRSRSSTSLSFGFRSETADGDTQGSRHNSIDGRSSATDSYSADQSERQLVTDIEADGLTEIEADIVGRVREDIQSQHQNVGVLAAFLTAISLSIYQGNVPHEKAKCYGPLAIDVCLTISWIATASFFAGITSSVIMIMDLAGVPDELLLEHLGDSASAGSRLSMVRASQRRESCRVSGLRVSPKGKICDLRSKSRLLGVTHSTTFTEKGNQLSMRRLHAIPAGATVAGILCMAISAAIDIGERLGCAWSHTFMVLAIAFVVCTVGLALLTRWKRGRLEKRMEERRRRFAGGSSSQQNRGPQGGLCLSHPRAMMGRSYINTWLDALRWELRKEREREEQDADEAGIDAFCQVGSMTGALRLRRRGSRLPEHLVATPPKPQKLSMFANENGGRELEKVVEVESVEVATPRRDATSSERLDGHVENG